MSRSSGNMNPQSLIHANAIPFELSGNCIDYTVLNEITFPYPYVIGTAFDVLGMINYQFHTTIYWAMLWLKLNHISARKEI